MSEMLFPGNRGGGEASRKTTVRRLFTLILLAWLWPLSAGAAVTVKMQTVLGDIYVELDDAAAPKTVDNFLNYVRDGDYTNSIIHRSIPGFIIQGGGYVFNNVAVDMSRVPADPPVENEFKLSNVRGTIAMAKLPGDPDSATSEWFFNLDDNTDLDTQNGGFTVFGRVIGDGMDVVDAIAAVPTYGLTLGDLSFSDIPLRGFFFFIPEERNMIIIRDICEENDLDSVCDTVEDGAPNGGDGNADGAPDRTQKNVSSFPVADPTGAGSYITLVSPPSTSLDEIKSLNFLESFNLFLQSGLPRDRRLVFSQGIMEYAVKDLTAGAAVTVILMLPAGEEPSSYYQYGPTSDNPAPHWYEFMFDGTTGAQINGNIITVHYADGQRGDDDLTANGVVSSTSAPVVFSDEIPTQTAGCSLTTRAAATRFSGEWLLVVLYLVVLHYRRRQPGSRCRTGCKS